MSYEFKCSPVVDVYIYAGIIPNLEERFNRENDVLNKGTPVYQEAFKNYKESFEKHQKEINFDLVSLVSLVDRNITEIKKAKPETVRRVAEKLKAMANDRLKIEEDWSGPHRFFHKIGQLFKGHGFKTEGAWAKERADALASGEALGGLDGIKNVFAKARTNSSSHLTEHHIAHIKQMKKEAFNQVIAAYVSGTVPEGMDNPYADLYQQLDQEKQQWLVEGILAQPSWPAQVVKLGIREFLDISDWSLVKPPPEIIKKVQDHPKQFFWDYNRHSDFYQLAAKQLMECAVIDYIERRDAVGMLNFIQETGGKNGCIAILLKNPTSLTPEHKAWLQEHFNLVHDLKY
jgi:hypothetical protein